MSSRDERFGSESRWPALRDFERFGTGGIFKEFEEMKREFARLFEDQFSNADSKAPRELVKEYQTPEGVKVREIGPIVYGYSVTIGPDGKSKIKEFGNVKPSGRQLIDQSGAREPLVDMAYNEKDGTVTITAEMPGVSKDDIKVNVSETNVSIHAEKGTKKYHAEIPLEYKLDDKTTKATYANGILELRMKAKEPPKQKGTEIKVE
jgi:HSP20 family protein